MSTSPFQHASASQVTTFARCERRWHFQSIQRIQTPSTDAQALGTAIHAELEKYTLEGVPPTHGSAQLALGHLPPPRAPNVLAERELESPELFLGGVRFKGFIDLLDVRDELHPHILDFKTTSDFRYAKSSEELSNNPQLLIYAAWALECVPEIEMFTLSHLYLKSKGTPAARLVQAKVKGSDVMPALAPVVANVERMKVAALAEKAEDLTPNWDACHDFGGCPFRDRCNTTRSLSAMFAASETTFTQTTTGTKSMSALLNKLKAATNKPASGATGILPPDAPKYPTASSTPAPAPATQTSTGPDINFYIVWNPDSDKPPHKRFVTLQEAQDCAAQMSAKNPGKAFFVCFAMAVSR